MSCVMAKAWGVAVALGTALLAAAADVCFKVTDDVVAKDPPRVGHNIIPNNFSPWGLPMANIWVRGPYPEPSECRIKFKMWPKVNGFKSGPDFIELEDGFGDYDNHRTGYWDGADYIVFRYDKDKDVATIVREGKVAKFTKEPNPSDKTAPKPIGRLQFAESGPAVQVDDEVVLRKRLTSVPPPEQVRQAQMAQLPWSSGKKAKQKLALDTKEKCPEGGSTASIRIPDGEFATQSYLGNAASHWIKLDPGDYLFRAWFKASKAGKIDVDIATVAAKSFDVGTEWKAYEFKFPAAHPSRTLADLVIKPSGCGDVWMDNITIHRTDTPLGAFFPEMVKELKAFRPSVLRLWLGQDGNGCLDDLIGPPAASGTKYFGFEARPTPDLNESLKLCEEVGADPWLILNVHMTPTEWRNFVEYMAGDASTPYGAKRAAAGRAKPWTDSFKTIYLECGNEVWSKIFMPASWMRDFASYAKYSHLMFASAKSHPAFKDEKFTFVGSDWGGDVDARAGDSFGSKAAKINSLMEATEVAHYTGGFDGYTFDDKGREAQMTNCLFYGPRLSFNRTEQHIKALASIRPGMRALSYEGGPGYWLPSPGKKYNEESEQVGKSLASAVTTADCYLYATSRGYGPMAAFFFAKGDINWSSHTVGWRPHAWHLALQMRNQLCDGDMVRVEGAGVPTVDIPEEEVTDGMSKKKKKIPGISNCPTVAAYAFKSAKGYDVYILSRELKNSHKVTITLPKAVSGKAELHSLANPDPWASNRESEVLKIASSELPANGGAITLELPPHSLHVIRAQAK